MDLPDSVDATRALLRSHGYIADRTLATAVFLALRLDKPLFVEGDAGVGKTELAKVIATALERRLIRLQCYEGIDLSTAVYEWNYPRQMIELRIAELAHEADRDILAEDIFSERFLIRRPLLEALEPDIAGPPVLLIDELDRADEPFEAFLLELLSDFQITIPEIGTIRAERPPIVVITSNRTREVRDAIKRRCLYAWLDYPPPARELEILSARVPGLSEELAREIGTFLRRLGERDLARRPGLSETIDWAQALVALGCTHLDPDIVDDTLGVLLKHREDIARIRGAEVRRLLGAAGA